MGHRQKKKIASEKKNLHLKPIIFVFVLLVIITWVLHYYNRPMDMESYLTEKAKGKFVQSKFIPVLIYATRPEKTRWMFMGSGSLFHSGKEDKIITADHLCSSDLTPANFAYRTLRPYDNSGGHPIASIILRGAGLASHFPNEPDAMIMKVGKNENWIECHGTTSKTVIQENMVYLSISGGSTLTSLVTGEHHTIIGAIENPSHGNTRYYLIDHECKKGESGSGFVDKEDNIYVLTSTVGDPPDIVKKNMSPYKNLCALYGGLQLK